MKYSKWFIVFCLILSACNQDVKETKEKNNSLKAGYWKGELLIQNHKIPFKFHIDSNQNMVVYNNDSELKMKDFELKNDSIKVEFNDFPNHLKFKVNSKNKVTGYFVNPDYKNPELNFSGKYIGDTSYQLYKNSNAVNAIAGKWEVKFISNTDHPYFAIGKFYEDQNKIKGTFLKNSGDEGFLGGTFKNDSLKLYSFNGAYASLFMAELKNDTLKGLVLSGNSGKTHWKAFKNENFQLPDKDSLTYMVKDELQLNLKTVKGADFTYPNKRFEDKVVILQIMGTWCPNCLDETKFFKELYQKYHKDGLEIVSIAYEKPKTFKGQAKRVQRFINSKNIPYPIVIGGGLSDKKVEKDFSMLNDVGIFPTAIYIDKKGDIAKIYTGFGGPGTGDIYEKYRKETMEFIEQLLQQ